MLVHLVVLYAPSAGGGGQVPGLDKLVHALVFGAVAVTGRRAGLSVPPLAALLLAHAVLSEVLQAALLPGRSGDPLDALADGVGALLGLAVPLRARAGSATGGRMAA